jgi:hypothetical protein
MTTYETYGNDSDKPFKVVMKGHAFDSFECPFTPWRRVARCGTRIVAAYS